MTFAPNLDFDEDDAMRLLICLFAMTSLAVAAERPRPQVPEGFEVEVSATFPQLQRPIFAHFDDRGRLYIGESSGVNLNRAQMLEQKPHWITRLEDADGDGVFERATKFVDNITLPQGMLFYRGSVYAACPPSIWKFTDTDDDGQADQREEILTGFGFNGNACDTHGPFLSPSGRLYIAQGRHGHEFKDADGKIISKGKAARIYSCWPDGSDPRVHAGGGFDNPVELEFSEEGDLFGTVNILYPNRGDCLMHWQEGGVYPREDQLDCISEFKWTGGLLGPVIDVGHVAVSGLMRYRGTSFGKNYQGSYFITEFNTHKVKRAVLTRSGTTFAADVQEFLTCADTDFHPTEILEDADGSLLVVDTGAWFLNGCPTSRVSKPDTYGAIYRIRAKAAKPVSDPRGLKLQLANSGVGEWLLKLNDPRPAVREQAIELLAAGIEKDFVPYIKPLRTVFPQDIDSEAPLATQHGVVWALARAGALDQLWDLHLRGAAGRLDTSVARSVLFALAEHSDKIKLDVSLVDWLAAKHGTTREAAVMLARLFDRPLPIRNLKAVQTALTSAVAVELYDGAADRTAEHALIVALTRGGERDFLLKLLRDSKKPPVRRACLIALDQRPDSPLTAALVTPLLSSADVTLQKTALEVLSRHPGWAKEALSQIQQWLSEPELTADRATAIKAVLIAQANEPAVQELVGSLWTVEKTPSPAVQKLLLEVIAQNDLAAFPESWVGPLLLGLSAPADLDTQTLAVQAVQRHVERLASRYADQFDQPLLDIAGAKALPHPLRCQAYAAAFAFGVTPGDAAWFEYLTSLIGSEANPVDSVPAARALAAAPRLSVEQRLQLAGTLEKANPLIVPTLLKAFELEPQETVGQAVVKALLASPAAESLAPDELAGILRRYPSSVQTAAQPLFQKLGVDPSAQQKRLDELATLLEGGDVKAGQAVFFGKRANCGACHLVGNQGGRIGPDLTKIGASRAPRDLLEAVVYPSASFVNGYRPFAATLTSGRTIQGVVWAESSTTITFRTQDLQEIRILRSDIDEIRESATSIMPKGLDTQLTPDELRNLLAYLQARK